MSVERQWRVSSAKITRWEPRPGFVGGWDGGMTEPVVFLELTRRLSGLRQCGENGGERVWKPWPTHSHIHQILPWAQF